MKYPRTHHHPNSNSITSDDKKLQNLDSFINKEVVLSLKMDGENSSMTSLKYHARSLDTVDHISRHWIKQLHANIKYKIPDNWRICGENLWQKHSIFYDNLPSYFLVFNIWNELNECITFDETLEYCELLDLHHVPIVYRGLYKDGLMEDMMSNLDTTKNEGLVMRTTDKFHYDDFKNNVVKMVRKNHVTTDKHWLYDKVIKNQLINEK